MVDQFRVLDIGPVEPTRQMIEQRKAEDEAEKERRIAIYAAMVERHQDLVNPCFLEKRNASGTAR